MYSQQTQHMLIVAAMVVSFVAVTFLINDWRHGSEHLVQIDPQPQHLYYTTQQNETPGTQTVYQCQRPGIFCTVVDE